MACPYINPDVDSECCKPVDYRAGSGETYRFWRHTDPDGNEKNVQHCKLIGRKGDAFECLNEGEYRACRTFQLQAMFDKKPAPPTETA